MGLALVQDLRVLYIYKFVACHQDAGVCPKKLEVDKRDM
jgi:hypothetical protein